METKLVIDRAERSEESIQEEISDLREAYSGATIQVEEPSRGFASDPLTVVIAVNATIQIVDKIVKRLDQNSQDRTLRVEDLESFSRRFISEKNSIGADSLDLRNQEPASGNNSKMELEFVDSEGTIHTIIVDRYDPRPSNVIYRKGGNG